MKIVEIKNQLYPVAEQWNELTTHQLKDVLEVLYGTDELVVGQTRLFKILLGISWWRLWYSCGAEELEDKLYLTDFLLQSNTLTRNPVPYYKGLYGPADAFHNLIACEFDFAEHFYETYKKTESVEALDKLIAILYRPGKPGYNLQINEEGDIRKPFSDSTIPYYSQQVRHWPMPIKRMIVHWYEGCRLKLIEDHPQVFGGNGGEAGLYGLFSVMRGVAEKGIHGTFEQVERMLVINFCMTLAEMVVEAERLQRANKTN